MHQPFKQVNLLILNIHLIKPVATDYKETRIKAERRETSVSPETLNFKIIEETYMHPKITMNT